MRCSSQVLKRSAVIATAGPAGLRPMGRPLWADHTVSAAAGPARAGALSARVACSPGRVEPARLAAVSPGSVIRDQVGRTVVGEVGATPRMFHERVKGKG